MITRHWLQAMKDDEELQNEDDDEGKGFRLRIHQNEEELLYEEKLQNYNYLVEEL